MHVLEDDEKAGANQTLILFVNESDVKAPPHATEAFNNK